MKKRILLTLAAISFLTLASCQNGQAPVQSTGKYRGTVDETIEPNLDIPDAIKPKGEALGYLVKHLIENKDGGYDLAQQENLSGEAGKTTAAEAKNFPGYEVEDFTQKTISATGDTVVEIKYKAVKYTLTLAEMEGDFGIISGEGDYYSYDNNVILTAKPNIGYDFLGWYDGDDLISDEKTYNFSITSNLNLNAKFEISDSFKYFKFTSTQSSCVITGLVMDAPYELIIPENVTEIAQDAFQDKKLNKVVLPKTLSRIGDYAFNRSTVLSVVINSKPEFGEHAFYNCSRLFELYNCSSENDSDKLELLYDTSSYGYIAYNAYTIHNSLDEKSIYSVVGDYLFAAEDTYATLMSYFGTDTELSLPETITIDEVTYNSYDISQSAFRGNKNLTMITIPSSVDYIGDNAFTGCTSLYEVYNLSTDIYTYSGSSNSGNLGYYAKVVHESADEPQQVFRKDNMVYYTYTENETKFAKILEYKTTSPDLVIEAIDDYSIVLDEELFQSNKLIETVTLDNSVKKIGDYAFNGCTNIKSVKADGVLHVGVRAFSGDNLIKNVSLASCTYIDNYAFSYAQALNSIDMSSVETIGAYTFQNCYNLYEVILPQSLTSIGSYAFQYCYKLRQVVNKSNLIIAATSSNGYVGNYSINIATAEDNFLDKTNGYVTYMDGTDKVLLAYIGDSKVLNIPADVTKVYTGALCCGDYTSVTFPEGAYMSDGVLYKCENIEYLDVPFDEYFDDLFDGLGYYDITTTPSKLKTLRISGEDIELDSSTFSGMSTVENLCLACTIYSISYSPFSTFTNLQNVYFDGSIEDWMDFTFNEEGYTPMSKASNFYMLDENGDNTLFGAKYSLLEELTIPDNVALGDYQFYGFGIKKLVLPNTVSNFGTNVFANCKNLEEIVLGDLTTIPTGIFSGCTSLKEITLPETVTTIEYFAFSGCSSLKSIDLSHITNLGEYAFSGCGTLTSVVVPTAVTEISSGAFNNCYGLQKVEMLGNVTAIGEYAFKNCYTLNSINLPNTIATIGTGAFQNCEAIKSISFKDLAVTEISPYLFSGCKSLVDFEFSNNITTVGDHAFDNCKRLALTNDGTGGNYFGPEDNPYKWFVRADKDAVNIVVKEGCEIVLESAFSLCKTLKSLVIPNSVTSLGKILKSNKTIETLSVPFLGDGGSNATINYTFGETSTYYNYAPQSLKSVTITGDVTSIPDNAFKNATSIKTINLPDTIETIGTYALYKTGITSLKLGSSLTSLGNYAFASCTSLTSIDLSEVTSSCELGSYLFNGCTSLVSADLGGIKKVAEYMFLSCTKLTNVTLSNNLTTIDWYGFSLTNIKSFIAPSTLKIINNHAFEKSGIEFADLSQMDGANTYLMDSAFQECASLKKVILPNLKKIYSYAFYKCPNLEECDLPESLEELGQYVFAYSGLKHVVLPTNLKATTNGTGEFIYNEKLESVEIKCTNSSYISSKPFQGCTNIKSAILYEGVKNVSKLLFCDCTSLTSVTLPSTITTINQSAFNTCSSLTSIVIPANVTSIGDYAFSSCTKLLEVYNLSNLEFEIGSSTYGNVTKNALVIHTSLSEESIFVVDSDGFVFIEKDSKGYLFNYEGDAEEVTLPDSFTKGATTYNTYDIYEGAFKNNTTLKKITISGSVETLGKSAFEGCSEITDITVLDGLKYIKDRAFYNCTSLVNLSLPNSLYRVYGEYPFTNCGNLKTTTYVYNKYLGNENNPYLYLYGRTTADMNSLTIHSDCKLIGSRALTSLTYVTNVVIPEGVIGIGDYAFYECNTVTYISFPTTLEYINSYSFAHMSKLQKVLLDNTKVVELGSSAFDNGLYGVTDTNVINEITLPSTLKTIGENCFAKAKITSIVIPEGVEYIGDYAFKECSLLTDVVLPTTIKEMGGNVFYKCSNLVNVELGIKNATVGDGVFDECSNLENVYFDGTVEDWMTNTFVYSSSVNATPMGYASNFYLIDSNGTVEYNGNNYTLLEELIIPEGVEEIKNRTFYGFKKITSITFPSTLKSIGSYAFYANEELTEINLPSSVETIGDYAFNQCIAVESVVIPENVTAVGNGAFSSITSLTAVNLKSKNTVFGTSVFNYDRTIEAVYYDGTIEDWLSLSFGDPSATPLHYTDALTLFYIKDDLGTVTYKGNTYSLLLDVVVPDTVTKIKQYSFYGFNRIKTVTVPASVTEIEKYAFEYCYNLTYLNLTEGLTKIGTYAFANNTALVKMTLPSTLTSIASYAFQNCYKLVEVYNLSSLNISNGSSTNGYAGYYSKAIHNSSTDASILVEDSDGYIFMFNNKAYLLGYVGNETVLKVPEKFIINGSPVGSYDIYKYAFFKNTTITAVVLPESVGVIGEQAFNYCSSISYVVIPSTVTEIQNLAFGNTKLLYKVFYGSTADVYNNKKSHFETNIKNKTTYYYSETQPAPGNYWHFDENGLPAIWM